MPHSIDPIPTAEEKLIIGWREHIALPDWGVDGLLAKSDTGARASAIDVANLRELPNGRVRFEVITHRARKGHPRKSVEVEAPISRIKNVRSSNGHLQHRVAVKTLMKIGDVEQEVEFSLVCRRHMLCRVLLGRTALEDHFLVNSKERFLLSPPPVKKRRAPKSAANRKASE
jgi:hypothetical protein